MFHPNIFEKKAKKILLILKGLAVGISDKKNRPKSTIFEVFES